MSTVLRWESPVLGPTSHKMLRDEAVDWLFQVDTVCAVLFLTGHKDIGVQFCMIPEWLSVVCGDLPFNLSLQR